MGQAAQRAAIANDTKLIEASEQERVACVMFFGRLVTPENRVDQRRYKRLFENFDLDAAEELSMQRVREEIEKTGNKDAGVSMGAFSPELVEYQTTNDVLEYLTAKTDTKIPGSWVRYILALAERALALKEGLYTAPSQQTKEITAEPPAP